ncbi:hypothetical protein [Sphingobacterium sp. CZ-2]|uniref:hypothetical protein n=1 Tax=Sphingobacterium sp. CZ-2 TaxID=2557994 RepID=UPI00107019FC|nr:hypothetical protein [Sphingobacterium sp. CZ-2]QBR10722.1 hypothetical protein E3D81_00420 [Sphingobacterium sp. CZ-2]
MNNFQELHKNTHGLQIEKPIFTLKNFFSHSFADKEKFVKQVNRLDPYDRDKIHRFFNQLLHGFKPYISMQSKFNRKKMLSYFNVSFSPESGHRGYMLPNIEGISKLIKVYINGVYKIELNLDDLCEEAMAR